MFFRDDLWRVHWPEENNILIMIHVPYKDTIFKICLMARVHNNIFDC